MPAVLVQGVPDTHRLWDRMRAHLTRQTSWRRRCPASMRPRVRGLGRTADICRWRHRYIVDVDSLFDRIAWVLTKYTKQILRAAEPLELMRDREWRCREAAVAERRMDGAAW